MSDQQPLIQDGKLNMEIYIRDVIRQRPVYGRTSIKPHEENVVLQDVTYLLAHADQQAARLATAEAENTRLRNIEMAARQVIAELPKYAILGQATTEVKLATLQALWQVLDMKPGGGS